MRYVPTSVSEVFEWMDAFSGITGLLPSYSVMIYAELTLCPSVETMLAQISQRDIFLSGLDQVNPAQFRKEIRAQNQTYDEHLKTTNPEALEKRIDHYFKVFRHHGFDRKMIEKIIDHLSPSSEIPPTNCDLGTRDVSGFFNPEPWVAKDEDDDDDDDEDLPEELLSGVIDLAQKFSTIRDHQRLMKSVDPTGWVALMRELKFEVIPESVQAEHMVGVPSFFIRASKGNDIPVFIVAAPRSAYDHDDTTAKAMKHIVQIQLAMNSVSRALLFYGAPSVISDDKEMKDGLVFWGEVFWDSNWGEMILHQKTNSFDRIVRDAKVVSQGIESFNKKTYKDNGLALMNLWVDHHNFAS